MLNTAKTCQTCSAWQSQAQGRGECRKNAPAVAGWPKTNDADWCCQWLKDQRPPAPAKKEMERWQVGINYVFVRDFPEQATTWLQAALAEPERIPEELRPVLADPLGDVLTDLLPDWVDGGPCCERVLLQAEQLPGFCNDETAAGDDDYIGLLMSMSNDEEIAASRQALTEIPADHPWRGILAELKAESTAGAA